MAEQSFVLKFLSDVAPALGGFQQLLGGAAQLGQGVESLKGKLQGLAGALSGGLLGAAASFFATSKLKEYMADAGNAARGQKELANALAATGQYSAGYLAELNELAEAQKQKLGVDDDEITTVQKYLVQFGAKKETIGALTEATLNYASAMKMDYASAATMIGRAMAGQADGIRGISLGLKQTTDTLSRQQQIAEQLDARFGGSAALGNTATRQATLAQDDLGKAIGGVLNKIKGSFFADYAAGINKSVASTQALISDHRELIAGFASVARAVGKFVGDNFTSVLALGALLTAVSLIVTGVTLFGGVLGTVLGPLGVATAAVLLLADDLGIINLDHLLEQFGNLTIAGVQVKEWAGLIKDYLVLGFDAIDQFCGRWLLALDTTIEKGTNAALAKVQNFVVRARAALADAAAGAMVGAVGAGSDAQAKLEERLRQNKAAADAQVAQNNAGLDAKNAATDARNTGALDLNQVALDARSLGVSLQLNSLLTRTTDALQQSAGKMFAPPSPENKTGGGLASGGGGTKGAGGKDPATAHQKAVDEGSEAEKRYQMLLDETKGKLALGMISQEQSNTQISETTRAYIAQLEALQSKLDPVSDKYHEMTVRILAAQKALAGTSVMGNVKLQLTDLVNKWGDASTQIGNWAAQSATTISDNIGSALTDATFRTGNWGQTMLQTEKTIVGSLIKIGLQLLEHYILSKFIKQSQTADTLQQNAATSASNASAGILESIKSYGVAAVLGIAAFAAAMAFAGGFAAGGLIPGQASHTDNQFAAVASGEYVVKTAAVQHYGVDLLHSINSMGFPMRRPTVNAPAGGSDAGSGYSPTGRAAGPQAGGRGGSSQPIVINNWHVADKDFALKQIKTTKGYNYLHDAVAGMSVDFGLNQ